MICAGILTSDGLRINTACGYDHRSKIRNLKFPCLSFPMTHPKPATVGQLKETGYKPCSVKDELRRNVIRKLKAGDDLFPGIVGYRDSVIPQIINGILSRHDLLFLGLRGQAKTRILRMLPDLLDEWMPVLAGIDINDDPLP